jgi:predicted Zn-dependent protease
MSMDPERLSRQRSIGLRLFPLLLGAIAIGFMMIRGCQEGPFGRKQVVALNEQQEMALGAQAFQQVLQQSEVLPAASPASQAVQRLAKQLVEASQNKDLLEHAKLRPQHFQWEARVVRSRDVNAFCLPGGKIVVYTGILPVAQTESALAAVMGHEIAHALAHHGAERMAQQKMMEIGQMAAAGSMSDMDPERRRQLMGVLGVAGQFGVLLPHSRKHESEADHLGLLLMATAGHDPKKAIVFWQQMTKASAGGKQPEFMSTHPSHETRIRDLESWQEEALEFYKKAPAKHEDRPLPH